MSYNNAITMLKVYLSMTFGDLHEALQAVIFDHDKHRIRGMAFICSRCGRDNRDHFVLEDPVWHQAAGNDVRGMMHLACVEEALGRRLVQSDFKDIPLNSQARYFLRDDTGGTA